MSPIPIKGHLGFYVHPEGFVFKVKDGSDIPLKVFKHPKSGHLTVKIAGKKFNVLNLMLEHFFPEINNRDKITHKITKDNKVPLKFIVLKPNSIDTMLDADYIAMNNYGCAGKAASSNARRSAEIILPVQVYNTLRRHDFKCVYCEADIIEKDWHLDHFIPLSKGGKNVFYNIVPSCRICNYMKGAFFAGQFYKQCVKIAERFMYKHGELGELNKELA